MKLSILILTLKEREEKFKNLTTTLIKQANELQLVKDIDYEILPDNRERPEKVGTKRNTLLNAAKGKYLCFFDDDDMPRENYFKHIMEGIEKNVDCISLRGFLTSDGKPEGIFEHSLIYKEWRTNENATNGDIKYERYPNHLNIMRSDIAKQFQYPEKNHGEDHEWSTKVFKSGLLKTEHYVHEIIYNYIHTSNK